jgi:hypothetical protein
MSLVKFIARNHLTDEGSSINGFEARSFPVGIVVRFRSLPLRIHYPATLFPFPRTFANPYKK